MTEIEKIRKRTRENWKNKMRNGYKKFMNAIKLEISYATENSITYVADSEYRFATWLVMKKLERKGYKCDLKKGDWINSIFADDRLYINWEKSE